MAHEQSREGRLIITQPNGNDSFSKAHFDTDMGIKATGFTRYHQKYQRALRLSDTLLGIVEARSS